MAASGGGSSSKSKEPLSRTERNRLYQLLVEHWNTGRVQREYARLYPDDRLPSQRTIARLRNNRKLQDLIAERTKAAIIEGYGPQYRRILDVSQQAEAWNDLFYDLLKRYQNPEIEEKEDGTLVIREKISLGQLTMASKAFLELLKAIREEEQSGAAPGPIGQMALAGFGGGAPSGSGPAVVVQSANTTIEWPDFQSYEEVVAKSNEELRAIFEKMLVQAEEALPPGDDEEGGSA